MEFRNRFLLANRLNPGEDHNTDPTGADAAGPTYRQQRDYAAAAVPLVLEGRVIATLPVAELLH